MIISIQGTLTAATPLHAVVELDGFGYEVNIPVTTAEKLPSIGATVTLHTLVMYREDAQTLYGFATSAERDFFRLMIEHVTGVGPKMALSIMSKLSLPLLEGAIRNGDIATLAKCPGIGKKTAERLVIELRAKVGATGSSESVLSASGSVGEGSAASGDNVVARRNNFNAPILGFLEAAYADFGRLTGRHYGLISEYKTADADESVRRVMLTLGPKATTEQLIKKALGS